MGIENITLINTDSLMLGVREVIIGVVAGVIIMIIGYYLIEKRNEAKRIEREEERIQKAEEAKQIDKLEQEQNKETERKNEISHLIQSLLPEIIINQNRLQPLSDCVDKVLDCNICEYSEEESLPEKLLFERTVYSFLLGKIGLLDKEINAKTIQYYSETKDIEEEYKKFDVIHGLSHEELNSFMPLFGMDEKLGNISYPLKDEIEEFLRHTKKIYDLGVDLINSMENNTGA